MRPVEGKSFSFTVPGLFTQEKYKNLILEPFYGIHDSRYMMYWLSMSEPAFREYKQAVEAEETWENDTRQAYCGYGIIG